MSEPTSRSCMPSCFTWEDSRTYTDNGNKVEAGYIRNQKTGYTYGMVKRTNCDLRFLLAVLAIFQAPALTLVRIPMRIIRLFHADFVATSRNSVEREWLIKNSRWSQQWTETNQTPIPASQSSICSQVALRSLWQLIKDIVRIVTYPIAIIALEFAALYGAIAHPLDGQKMWADIEHFWSSDPISIESNSDSMIFTEWFDYFAPCTQPKEVWDARNLYRTYARYDKNTLRSLTLALEQRLILERDFLIAEGADVDKLQRALNEFKQNNSHLKKISATDRRETFPNGILKHTSEQFEKAQEIARVIAVVDIIKELRTTIITAQLSFKSIAFSQRNEALGTLSKAQQRLQQSIITLNALPQKLVPTAPVAALPSTNKQSMRSRDKPTDASIKT